MGLQAQVRYILEQMDGPDCVIWEKVQQILDFAISKINIVKYTILYNTKVALRYISILWCWIPKYTKIILRIKERRKILD